MRCAEEEDAISTCEDSMKMSNFGSCAALGIGKCLGLYQQSLIKIDRTKGIHPLDDNAPQRVAEKD